MGDGKVEYVNFGGALVPENSRRTTIPDEETGKKLYCVFLDDKGTKITYPEQNKKQPKQIEYVKLTSSRAGLFGGEATVHETNISKAQFDSIWEDARSFTSCENLNANSVKSYYKGDNNLRRVETGTNTGLKWYYEGFVDTQPKVEIQQEGLLFNTNKMKVSNFSGATVKGSEDEDDITLQNSDNCTIEVDSDNNNILFSDNVKVVNGSGNKVVAGDYDKTTFAKFDYNTAKETAVKQYKGEGKYKQ